MYKDSPTTGLDNATYPVIVGDGNVAISRTIFAEILGSALVLPIATGMTEHIEVDYLYDSTKAISACAIEPNYGSSRQKRVEALRNLPQRRGRKKRR